MKAAVQGYTAELLYLKTELKSFKELFGQFTGAKGSTAQSAEDTEFGLDDLANAAEKEGHADVLKPLDVVDQQVSEASPTKP